MFTHFEMLQAIKQPIKKRAVALIGAAGKKGTEYLHALMKRSDLDISAVVINKTSSLLIEQLEKQGVQVIRGGRVDTLISNAVFDIAIISVPHNEHHLITTQLLQAGKYIIKEKPLAVTWSYAEQYARLIKTNDLPPLFTTLQRKTLPSFLGAKKQLHLIGKPTHFNYNYWFNLSSVTTGWRSKMETAYGGVILDMGYHILDILTYFFGESSRVLAAKIAYKYPETAQEQLEDYANIILEYPEENLKGEITLDRHAAEKKEVLIIDGVDGQMVVTPQGYQIFNAQGLLIEDEHCPASREEEISRMFDRAIPRDTNICKQTQDFSQNMHNMLLIKQIDECKQVQTKERIPSFKRFFPSKNAILSFATNNDATITCPLNQGMLK